MKRAWLIFPLSLSLGCAGTIVQPGHRALLFDPIKGGVQHDVLQPGYYPTPCPIFSRACPRVDDFDVTYTRQLEHIQTNSKEGLVLDLKLTLVYRPIVQELYLLDTEIGPNFYEEVIGPEFRSAARGVFARNSYLDLQARNEKLEDEIEVELRRRVEGKHVAVESVLLESVSYAPEIVNAVRARLVGEQDAARQKAMMETEGARKLREIAIAAEEKRLAAENEMQRRRLEIETGANLERIKAEQQKIASEAALHAKKAEHELAVQQAEIDKINANKEADVRIAQARAKAEENKADALARTEIDVAIHAYDALGKLGGENTTILLGDFSKVPQLIPPKFGSPLSLAPMQVTPKTK